MPNSQNIAQRVNFEFVKVAVDGRVEQGLELDDAGVDFVLFELVEGCGAGFVIGGVLVGGGGEAETEAFGGGVG